MKVKKLLTLLLVSAVLSACGSNTKPAGGSSSVNDQSSPSGAVDNSSLDNSSNAGNPSSPAAASSSAAPAASSSAAPAASSSAAPAASSSAAPAASSSAAPAASSSAAASSSSQQQAPTLASIRVTAPTKTTYTTDDTSLDLTGMVVTAVYSDSSEQVIEAGYEVSTPDFSTPGTKTVTVTFQGQSDTFEITVENPKPTAWSTAATQLMQNNLYGYVLPFFYGPDFGTTEPNWRATSDGEVYATGTLTNLEQSENSVTAVAQFFYSGGQFTLTQNPSASAPYYKFQKEVQYQESTRVLELIIGAVDTSWNYVKSGYFFISIQDANYNSWAELQVGGYNFEALMKSYFGATDDIPDLPDGALFPKSYVSSQTYPAVANGRAIVPLYVKCSAEYALAVPTLFATANPAWTVIDGGGDTVIVISPSEKLQIKGTYYPDYGFLVLQFSEPAEYPERVGTVAGLLGMSKYLFTYYSRSIQYYMSEVSLQGEEQNLQDLFNRYAALLTAGDVLSQGGDTSVKEDEISANYFKVLDEGSYKVELSVTADTDATTNETTYGVSIIIRDYEPLPTVVRSIVAALELNEFDFNSSQNGFFFADDDILPATATLQEMAAAVGALRDKLLAATELGFEADGNISSDGDGGCYIDLYSETCNKKVEFWAHVERDSSNNVEAVILQTSISDYTPPAFALKDAFVARTGLSLKWQNSSGYFFYGDSVELGEGETMQDRVESLVDELYECEDENDPFSELEAGGTEGSFYKATYFCNAGYFTIICGLTSGGNTVVNIQAAPFNPEVPGRVSVIALQLGAGTVEIVNEQYVCLAKSDGRYGTAGYTRRQIVDNKWGEEFLADIITNKGMTSYVLQGEITYDENGVVRATYFNESNGFTLVMSMPYDEDGETIGIQIIIIPPAPQPDPGE